MTVTPAPDTAELKDRFLDALRAELEATDAHVLCMHWHGRDGIGSGGLTQLMKTAIIPGVAARLALSCRPEVACSPEGRDGRIDWVLLHAGTAMISIESEIATRKTVDEIPHGELSNLWCYAAPLMVLFVRLKWSPFWGTTKARRDKLLPLWETRIRKRNRSGPS